jgi:uncharacterized membrane protein YfcA
MGFPSVGVMVALLAIGVVIGIVSGMIGIGGGVLVIPVLMTFFSFSQEKANGTSLAMLLPPIGIFAVLAYKQAGNIDVGFAILLALGFAVGAYFGALLINSGRIHPTALRIMFAMLLLYVAGRMLFRSGGRAGIALQITILMAGFLLTYIAMRLFGRRLERKPDWSQMYRERLQKPITQDYEI